MALLSMDFWSNCLLRTVSINAIIPFDAEGAPRDSFKTLYLLHGLTGSKSDWLLNTRIAQMAQERNLAVIMPNGENMFYLDNETTKDNFGEFIGRELVEATRSAFRLSDKREDTFIAGLSMGGYGAIRNGLKYNETFGYLAGMSPALIQDWIGDEAWEKSRAPFHEWLNFGAPEKIRQSDKHPFWLVEHCEGALPSIYLSCGTEDGLIAPTRDFHAFLLEKGIDHKYVETPGLHDWGFWNADIQRVLDWLPL